MLLLETAAFKSMEWLLVSYSYIPVEVVVFVVLENASLTPTIAGEGPRLFPIQGRSLDLHHHRGTTQCKNQLATTSLIIVQSSE